MRFSHWTRQVHRWGSVVFTLLVLANFVVNGVGMDERTTLVVGLAALVPLFTLLFTGLYLFVLPYIARWRSGRRTD